MKRSRFVLPILGIVAILSSAGFFAAGKAEPKEPIAMVRGGALGHSIQVLGKLDEPLGTLLTLRGNFMKVAIGKGADPDRMFEVQQVGDRVLTEPVVINLGYRWYGETPIAPGTRLELIGYERGGFSGIAPAENDWQDDPRNRHEGSGIPQARGWHFLITFRVLQFDELPASK